MLDKHLLIHMIDMVLGWIKLEEAYKDIFYKQIEKTTVQINNLYKKYRIETFTDS